MKKTILLSMLMAFFAVSAQAGYVDERTPEQKAAADLAASRDDALAGRGAYAAGAPVASPARATGVRAAGPAVFSVEPGDATVRSTLVRWAQATGWTHGPEHWTISKDHPIQGLAGKDVFGASFATAVRVLVSTTEMTDMPVQPCFYSNRVLRIIPIAASCQSN